MSIEGQGHFLNVAQLLLSLFTELYNRLVTIQKGVVSTISSCLFLFLSFYFLSFSLSLSIIEPRHEKTNVLVSDLVRHKPGCTTTENGLRLEISDLESRGIVLSF